MSTEPPYGKLIMINYNVFAPFRFQTKDVILFVCFNVPNVGSFMFVMVYKFLDWEACLDVEIAVVKHAA